MVTVAELAVQEELALVREVVESRAWMLTELDSLHFFLGLPASDGTQFYLAVDCDAYPVKPAAWHWCNSQGGSRDVLSNVPRGTDFFHTNGVICAPWNRLAYKAMDPRGPHSDWAPHDWRNNRYTKGCRTLSGMVLRIAVELQGPRYHRARLA